MDNNKEVTAINLMAEQLAKITAYAVEVEHQRDEAEKNKQHWYQMWQKADDELIKTKIKLACIKEENDTLCEKLKSAGLTENEKEAGANVE